MTPEAYKLWRDQRGVSSHWRMSARIAMAAVVDAHPELLADDVALLKAVDAAYPFGERAMLPYKMWLLERKAFRAAMSVPAAPPSRDEAEVCSVARDLVEIGRLDEARRLVEEQAPNRLGRKCPACGVGPGGACWQPGDILDPRVRILIVPHEARLVGHLGAGPLFEARS